MMKGKVMLKKGTSRMMRHSEISPSTARRLSDAIKELETRPLPQLIKNGRVKKLKVSNNDNVYAYRAGIRERIVFSPIDGKNIIHQIVGIK